MCKYILIFIYILFKIHRLSTQRTYKSYMEIIKEDDSFNYGSYVLRASMVALVKNLPAKTGNVDLISGFGR